MSPSQKCNFKNTDFIDVAPVVRTSKDGGPLTISDQEETVEVKIEAGTSFEFSGKEKIVIGEPASENPGKDEHQDGGESDADGEEAGGGVVKLQPRVGSVLLCRQIKDLQDEKTLQAESLKEIKHKTKCKVCQGEFKNRQVENQNI